METLSAELLAWLFLAGLAGGFVDSIAGGGGLISVPALLAAGLGPVSALATNKAQAVFGSLTATVTYARRGHVAPAQMKAAIGWTFIGSMIGALAVQSLPSTYLEAVVPVLLIGVALYFLFGPRLREVDRHHWMESGPFYALFGLALGFYDGFFGPGTGSLWALAFVAVLGFNLLKATAHTKVLNLTSNFAALLMFAAAGYVHWPIALVMAVGQLAGARLGALLAIKHGGRVIRPILVVVSLLITAKIIMDDPDNVLHSAIATAWQ